jgi:hypothetical protein
MLTDLPFDPLAAGARSHRVSAIPDLCAGEWNTLLDVDGPGMITHLWFTFPRSDRLLGRRNLLRFFWDDEAEPSVVAPLSDFFGLPFGFTGTEYQLKSRYLVVAPNNGLNCYFRMPFARRARVEIFPDQLQSGGGFYFQADHYSFDHGLPACCGDLRFHAQFRLENPCEAYGRNYLFLAATGQGLLLGATCGIQVQEPRLDSWYHGGGDTILIDGEDKPGVLHGIGAEDFFGHSWGVDEFQSPAVGTPWRQTGESGGADRVSLYRFFLDDPVPFRTSIRGVLGAMNNAHSSVAYWYQSEPHVPFFAVPPADKRLPDSSVPYGRFDLDPGGGVAWRLLAPFALDTEHPFEAELPLEQHESGAEIAALHVDGHATRSDGNELSVGWTAQIAQHHFVDFHTVARPAVRTIRLLTGVVGYAVAYVESEQIQDVRLHVGFDDEIRVRVNSDVVLSRSHDRGFELATCVAHLVPGTNRIFVKLSNHDNHTWRYWGFCLRWESL